MEQQSKPCKKKKIIAAAVAVLLVVSAVGVTFALLRTKSDTATNEFAGAKVNVGVVENGKVYENPGNSTTDNVNDSYTKVTSGTAVTKEVAITNINSLTYPTTDTYVRVRLVPQFIYNEGTDYAGQIVAMDMQGKVTYTYATDTAWKYQDVNGEKYYYYTEIVKPGDTTANLITSVKYTGDVPKDAHFELKVLTEGIAAHQTVGGKESLSAWGLTSEFNGLTNVN